METETPQPEKRKRGRPFGSTKKLTKEQLAELSFNSSTITSYPPPKLKVVKPKKKANPDSEIHRAMRRLGIATKGMGPGAPEIFKAAILQCVQAKMEEICVLLRQIGPGLEGLERAKAPGLLASNGPIIQPAPARQLTPDQADALIAKKTPDTGEVCQFCGFPAVYKTRRGVTVCVKHKAQGVADDQQDVLAATLRHQGFGGGEEVIRVPADVIQNALARGGQEE